MKNPLLELFHAVGGDVDYGNTELSVVRDRVRAWACRHYSWAVPTEAAVAEIARHAPIIEVGAGLGYWASLIREYCIKHTNFIGGGIVAFDWHKQGKENNWGRQHSKVHPISSVGSSLDSKFEESLWTLFVCWPPRAEDSPMLKECLDLYKGKTVLYVGEIAGTNGWDVRLGTDFYCEKCVDLPHWRGFRDNLYVFKRKEK